MTRDVGSKRVIGVFDSGVGGLTVVRRIWEKLSNVSVLFVADQAHVPYGGRPLTEVAGFARGISATLIEDACCSAIVMACNISTATALETVQQANPQLPVLGVIAPGAKAALRCTASSSVGVLATQGTVSTTAYTRTLHNLRLGTAVTEVACPEFVPLIESEQTESPEAFDAANRYLEPILKAGADVVILGCTHYPFMLPCLRSVAPHITFIDPAEETVCELAAVLNSVDSVDISATPPIHTLYTTGDLDVFTQQIAFFLPLAETEIVVRQARWGGNRLFLDAIAILDHS